MTAQFIPRLTRKSEVFFMADSTLPTTITSGPIKIHSTRAPGRLDADIIIANAPNPVFVSAWEVPHGLHAAI
jgi:hypothetical protein